MSTKQLSPTARRWLVVACGLAAAALALAAGPSDVIRLKDGSTLKGRLVRVDGDTLTIRLSIGSAVKVHRAQVESITFLDSLNAAIPLPTVPVSAPSPAPSGAPGTIAVKFEHRDVTSKITIDKKKHWDEKVRSNDILVEFVVDGTVAYSAVDTTTDKTIYMGPEKQLKNNAELKDFSVQVPPGMHRCSLVVRNRDPDTFRESFDPEPLEAVLDFDDVNVLAGGILRLDIRMDKGLLRMSSPRLYKSGAGE